MSNVMARDVKVRLLIYTLFYFFLLSVIFPWEIEKKPLSSMDSKFPEI